MIAKVLTWRNTDSTERWIKYITGQMLLPSFSKRHTIILICWLTTRENWELRLTNTIHSMIPWIYGRKLAYLSVIGLLLTIFLELSKQVDFSYGPSSMLLAYTRLGHLVLQSTIFSKTWIMPQNLLLKTMVSSQEMNMWISSEFSASHICSYISQTTLASMSTYKLLFKTNALIITYIFLILQCLTQ